MLLEISEEWIRQKVGLEDRDADEVQSLSLRGTHLEKISDLDESLKHFTRLQDLDLSHNAISRLEGLRSLKLLKKLNLYFNNVGSLDELLHLRHNTHLEELDLRLNPVAKNAPDYRLILIHLLPNLRRLDERAIRDSERKAALMLFSTSMAAGMSLKSAPREIKFSKEESLRTQRVKSLGKPMRVLDEDDIGIMEVLRKNDVSNLNNNAKAKVYDPSDIRQMNLDGIGYTSSIVGLDKVTDERQPMFKAKSEDNLSSGTGRDTFETRYPNISALTDMILKETGSQKKHHDSDHRCKTTGDPNLKFIDEINAYTSYTAKGHFTPAKKTCVSNGDTATGNHHVSSVLQERDRLAPDYTHPTKDIVTEISNLVDRYWNGSRSLLANDRFIGHLQKLLNDYGYSSKTRNSQNESQQIERLKSEVQRLEEKIVTLHEKYLHNFPEKDQKDNADRTLNNLLARTQTELSITKTRLKQCLEKNKILEHQIDNFTKAQTSQLSANESQIENMMLENARLNQDIQSLHKQLSESGNFKGLALMLQKSHESLIETNKHLMKEMEELRQSRDVGYPSKITFASQPRSYNR